MKIKDLVEKVKKIKIRKIAIVYFLIIMLILSIISRVYSKYQTPVVKIGSISSAALKYTASGTGMVKSGENLYYDVFPGIRIDKIFAEQGKNVKAGDQLIQLNIDDINKFISDKQKEIDKIDLSIKEADIKDNSVNDYSLRSSGTDLDNKQAALLNAKAAYEQVQSVTVDAQSDYNVKLSAYNKDQTESNKRALDAAKENLETQNSKAESLNEKYNAAQSAVEEAQKTYDDTQNSYNESIKEANEAKGAESIKNEGFAIDKEQYQKDLEKLNKLLTINGLINAETDGCISDVKVKEGEDTPSESYLYSISTTAGSVEAESNTDDIKNIAVGDEATLNAIGSNDKIEGKVSNISFKVNENKEQIPIIKISVNNNKLQVGSIVNYKVEKNSENYNTCVPISAIFQDNSGKYILVIEDRQTVLGTEYVAVKKSVEVVKQDNTNAYINTSVGENEKIIVESSKEIKDGDVVREKK